MRGKKRLIAMIGGIIFTCVFILLFTKRKLLKTGLFLFCAIYILIKDLSMSSTMLCWQSNKFPTYNHVFIEALIQQKGFMLTDSPISAHTDAIGSSLKWWNVIAINKCVNKFNNNQRKWRKWKLFSLLIFVAHVSPVTCGSFQSQQRWQGSSVSIA